MNAKEHLSMKRDFKQELLNNCAFGWDIQCLCCQTVVTPRSRGNNSWVILNYLYNPNMLLSWENVFEHTNLCISCSTHGEQRKQQDLSKVAHSSSPPVSPPFAPSSNRDARMKRTLLWQRGPAQQKSLVLIAFTVEPDTSLIVIIFWGCPESRVITFNGKNEWKKFKCLSVCSEFIDRCVQLFEPK